VVLTDDLTPDVGGILLTGGASRRLGRDKATLQLGPGGATLAQHLGSLLASATAEAIEVGSGASSLAVPDEPDPRRGPLAAIAVGARHLWRGGHDGPVLVLATDLPRVSLDLLRAITSWPAADHMTVVPVAGGRPQTLCARWSTAALERAVALDEAGERRVQAAFGAGDLLELGERELPGFALEVELADVDDEAALRRFGFDPLPRSGGTEEG
jgi:molybdopterin-guanine dinucleotide biosynthesis protein A